MLRNVLITYFVYVYVTENRFNSADWKRRGVGNSYQEALLKEVIELQTRALLRPISLPADEARGKAVVGSLARFYQLKKTCGGHV